VEWEQVAIEEYRTLRQESLESISQAQATLRGGLVVLGVLAGFGVNISSKGAIAQLILALAGPAFSTAVLTQWLLETRRAVRAGTRIVELELEFERRFGGDAPLRWERTVRKEFSPRTTFAYHWTVLTAVLAASSPAVALGLYALGASHDWAWLAVAIVADLLIVAWMLSYMRRNHRELTRLHELPAVENARIGSVTANLSER
jgi:hypothetical protein